MHTVQLTALAASMLSMAAPAAAFWRMPCQGRLGLARMDPIVNPGELSPHAHAIHGGKNFDFKVTGDQLAESDCTSCAVTQDKSAYWVPTLYFLHANGTAELAEQLGGTLVYYLLYGKDIKAFPRGLRMVSGDTGLRDFPFVQPDPPKSSWTKEEKTQSALGQKAIGFNCLNYASPPEASMYRHTFPERSFIDNTCANGLRLEIMFPSCWNGKDLDSKDHKSHVAYPSEINGGDCPEGFGTRLPTLFYETIWVTKPFAGMDGKFVISNGDPTGAGYHADFIEGWDDGVLQEAVDTCTNDSGLLEDCHVFNIQDQNKQNECKMNVPPSIMAEEYTLCPKGLPGGVKVSNGPGYVSGASHHEPVVNIPSVSIPAPGGPKLNVPTPSPPAPPAPPSDQAPPAPPAPPAPETTPKPSTPANPPGTTTTYTKNGTVFEVAIVTKTVTTTVQAQATPAKRDTNLLRHHGGHGHGGHRRRHGHF
ncbi:hypothetical protein H105_00669 [Trichophyton soudanense CBS 452.61]|uniref:DUF1996 domain-containing protein n=2 Tax=Trichophyton soudanense CBS 452.61 TaxID=1215331 RepID=A0A022Y5T1_TRISD|nr:hypothetical protein H105_00669 [Trichophyton soudanense CBS 452.61]EZG05745.1 hypothetical protein H106_04761 [Trichophyton rubrum CBS 735.88]